MKLAIFLILAILFAALVAFLALMGAMKRIEQDDDLMNDAGGNMWDDPYPVDPHDPEIDKLTDVRHELQRIVTDFPEFMERIPRGSLPVLGMPIEEAQAHYDAFSGELRARAKENTMGKRKLQLEITANKNNTHEKD